ncbi:MAG: malto-oligosyltrehalose trehalohydrolase [Burkholderiales bacterium]
MHAGNEATPVRAGRHAHDMPFGPQRIDPRDPRSGYRFRLWAPSAKQVELKLLPTAGGPTRWRCETRDGWHSVALPQARTGDLYCFSVDGLEVPDPASRYNPGDVHGPSQLIDPLSFDWGDDTPSHRPWHESVLYELHIGTFTAEGTFKAAERRLDYLAGLGVTTIELMPVNDFAGRRGWGYDGTLIYAPKAAYGHPHDLKSLIRTVHSLGMTALLDVVYNHFGPEGNYLHAYAPEFFQPEVQTAWGPAIDFDAERAAPVRRFFLHNALYWLDEYRFDGLRVDAGHAIHDRSDHHFLDELPALVRTTFPGRQVHLVLENHANEASVLGPQAFDAQWNDDFHHAAHVLLTGEQQHCYADFTEQPLKRLVRCLLEGFDYQGQPSGFAQGQPRGEPSAHLPATAFVNFLQNHDQVGNRLMGERLAALASPRMVQALVAVQLLAPGVPMVFMGEEFGATTPFLYFCDFEPGLAAAVREGRHREHQLAAEAQGAAAEAPVHGHDACEPSTFLASKLDWSQLTRPAQSAWLEFYARLIAARQRLVMPLLPHLQPGQGVVRWVGECAFELRWPARDGRALMMQANLQALPTSGYTAPADDVAEVAGTHPSFEPTRLPPWGVRVVVTPPAAGAEG